MTHPPAIRESHSVAATLAVLKAPAILPLPLHDYSLASRTIYSLLASEQGEHYKACLFYSIIGAVILKKHYGINACPMVGAALYRIGAERLEVLALAVQSQGMIGSSEDGFHSWVEADGWVLDFMAPLFPEILLETGRSGLCPRRAFQKRLTDGKSSLDDLQSAGDFIHLPNIDLTQRLLREFYSKRAYVDLLHIATDWFRRPPERMPGALEIGNGRGEVKSAPLLDLKLSGSW